MGELFPVFCPVRILVYRWHALDTGSDFRPWRSVLGRLLTAPRYNLISKKSNNAKLGWRVSPTYQPYFIIFLPEYVLSIGLLRNIRIKYPAQNKLVCPQLHLYWSRILWYWLSVSVEDGFIDWASPESVSLNSVFVNWLIWSDMRHQVVLGDIKIVVQSSLLEAVVLVEFVNRFWFANSSQFFIKRNISVVLLYSAYYFMRVSPKVVDWFYNLLT